MPYRELLLGAGNRRLKHVYPQGGPQTFVNVTTLDIDPDCKPDLLWDLNQLPLPVLSNSFDEIHAYEVLEHLGTQGDWRGFFAEFAEYWRILKPSGILFGSCPDVTSRWAWGDPGHTRIIGPECLTFLSQAHYAAHVGKTPMTDYRSIYKADFELICNQIDEGTKTFFFGLRAIK